MPWQVEYTDQFKDWWNTLSEGQQDDLAASVGLLMERGPTSAVSLFFRDIQLETQPHERVEDTEWR